MQHKKVILGVIAMMLLAFGVASAQSNENGYHDNGQYHKVPQHERQNHGTYHE